MIGTSVIHPEQADELFNETPEIGDEIIVFGEESIIVGVHIINRSKMEIKTLPKREVKRFNDPEDPSVHWNELPERFLEEETRELFNDKESLTIG